MANGLNHRQELFLAAYLSGPTKGNATASAQAAGYAEPNTQGPRLLVNVGVAARIAAYDKALAETTLTTSIADRDTRVNHLQDIADRLLTVFNERGAEPAMARVPGGTTGLLVRQYKQMRSGKGYVIREEYKVDDGSIGEFRATLRQVAEDLGQWVQKTAPTTPDGEHAYSDPHGDLAGRIAGIATALAARRGDRESEHGGSGPPSG